MTEYRENREFRILSAIGIILVVAGHLGYNVFDVGGLFPYYSFHVFIFLFVSGYFYKRESKDHILSYLRRKCVTLLLPYFVWNLLYGILAHVLHRAGFTIGQELSLYTLFVAPFDGGHQFMYHFSSWFVPVLFLLEVLNVCGRKVLHIVVAECRNVHVLDVSTWHFCHQCLQLVGVCQVAIHHLMSQCRYLLLVNQS